METHVPNSASTKQFIHYGQLVQSDRFQNYDYGLKLNFRIYGQRTPREYRLGNTRVPVAIFYADNDKLVAAEDVQRLPNKLSNVIEINRVNDATFNHFDFPWAKDAKELVYNRIVELLKSTNVNVINQRNYDQHRLPGKTFIPRRNQQHSSIEGNTL